MRRAASAIILFAVLWGALLATSEAYAEPGVECGRRLSTTEKLICRDWSLLRLDDEITNLYRAALLTSEIDSDLRSAQRRWLFDRDQCSEVECLRKVYEARISDLRATLMPERAETLRQAPHADIPEACAAIADWFNAPMADRRKPSAVLEFSRGSDRVDFDGDGTLDSVHIVDEGTAHWDGVRVIENDGGEGGLGITNDVDWEEGNLRWSYDLSLARFSGHWYLIGSDDGRLHYVAQIEPPLSRHLLCMYSQARKPIVETAATVDASLCKAVRAGKLNTLRFDTPHSVTTKSLLAVSISDTYPSERAARVDLDNDGSKEWVIQTELVSGRGLGCGSNGLAILDESRSGIAESDASASIRNRSYSNCKGLRMTPFLYGKKAYIEEKFSTDTPGGEWTVFRMDGAKSTTVCTFGARPFNYVLDAFQ